MGILPSFGDNNQGMPTPPTDREVAQQVQQQYIDPLAQAQLARANGAFDPSGDSTGVAMITVENRRMIDEFRARLRGYTIVRRINVDTGEEQEPEIKKFGEPVMNEEGVNHLVGLYEFTISKSIMLSNIPIKGTKISKNAK